MARDYVTIREPKAGAQTVWTFSNVSHMRLKSAPAKVTRRRDRYTIMGAAWGAPVSRVEVRIDNGPWIEADLDRQGDRRHGRETFAWAFWTLAVAQAGLGRALHHVARVRLRGQHPTTTGRPLPREPGHLLGEQRPDHPQRR